MSKPLIFIDGSAGTTGLRIRERLEQRGDLELLILAEEKRKLPEEREKALNRADIAFLCLPDAAAIEAVGMLHNDHTVVIDTSTAHRVADGWEYGFPELEGRRERIIRSRRIANPGCHASGFISLIAPLRDTGVLRPSVALTAFSLTGYSGGGKKMIAEYKDEQRSPLYDAPRQYGLSQQHKHIPEMKKICNLSCTPAFCPIVADFYSGMEVTVPVFAKDLSCPAEELIEIYQEYYQGGLVHFDGDASEGGLLSASAWSGRDDLSITLHGNEERVLLTARFDNLGKGASGAAIQNMNLCLGLDETTGLVC